MDDIADIVVGFDQKESVAYHTFVQSVIEQSTIPTRFMPLTIGSLTNYKEIHKDGSNDFIYSRFLVPYLMNYNGWAIYADGDMVCLEDIKKLWDLRDNNFAVQVVKHNYKTKVKSKYWGNKNEDYPRKNWSSLILWNCNHQSHKILTPEFIQEQTGSFLHRFSWIKDKEIGEVAKEWNWLAMEYEEKKDINLIHYTIGTPCFKEYHDKSLSSYWKKSFLNMLQGYYKKIN
ncbi:glycosyltransferase [Pseudomonadota bacterium]|nr:glycosyltransferase [Pseudomonadota bacterium]